MTIERNKIYQGDCLSVLKTLPDESVDCVITSPPYWGLRDYGVNGQLGLEKTPEEYVAKMVEIFREVRRVLKKEGTCWLNLGDSYYGGGWKGSQTDLSGTKQGTNTGTLCGKDLQKDPPHPVLKPKDLCGIPWRVAFALQADGWWLRQDVIWSKNNPMPESCTDRCTKSHEYIFLLTKSAHYFYDNEAIKEDSVDAESYEGRNFRTRKGVYLAGAMPGVIKTKEDFAVEQGKTYPKRNRRSVWTIPTQSFSGAHFATFPEKLVEPCILAGCPKEVCPKCGKARERMVDRKFNGEYNDVEGEKQRLRCNTISGGTKTVTLGKTDDVEVKTIGWSDCGCGEGFKPGIVLDPFGGAMTTALVAYKNNRDYVMIELSETYIKMGQRRLDEEKEKLVLFGNNPCVVKAGQKTLFEAAK